MSQACFFNRRVAEEMGIHHSVIHRLMQCCKRLEWLVKCSRSDRPRKITSRENMLIARCARKTRFATLARIRDEFKFDGWRHSNLVV